MSFKYISSPPNSTMSKPPTIQTRNLPLLATPQECTGKTYIVTGANSGLGFEAAKHLVSLGSAKVILAVRNLSSGEEAKSKIEAETNTKDVTEVWHLDLADYASIKTFAKKANELEEVDGLIANASIASVKKEEVNGQNDNVSINVIGTYLLGFQLFGKLSETARKRGGTSHFTVVSSRAGFDVKEVWDRIKESPLEGMRTQELGQAGYPLSKLIETLVARQFAALVPVAKSGVIVNVICPGLCITQLDRNAPDEFRKKLAELRADRGRTAEDGSRTLLHGVVAGEETHGLLLHSCENGEPDVPNWVKDEEGLRQQEKTWKIVRAELERAEPAVVASLGV